MPLDKTSKVPLALTALIAVQVFCAVIFVGDVIADFLEAGALEAARVHLSIESVATLSLMAAIAFEIRYLSWLLRRKARLEDNLRQASAAIHEVIEAQFESWGLTPAERDVAGFLVKGLATPEIARMRGSAEGTVKAQLNAIYRKSGTGSRSEMLSLLLDILMGQPGAAEAADGQRAAG